MSYPHISAALNNCPLHILTPELIQEIRKRAQNKNYSNAFDEGYAVLKDKFAEFYGLGQSFSWQAFNQLLEQYNAFDMQIILGPVLRLFMAESMRSDQTGMLGVQAEAEEMSVDGFIKSKTEITEDGRYAALSPDEIFVYVSKPLGFNLAYHRQGRREQIGDDDAIALLEIYHQGGIAGAGEGGHWERASAEREMIYYERENDAKLNAYVALLGNHAYTTAKGLELLKQQVRFRNSSLSGGDYTEKFARLALAVAQIEKFIYNINFLPKDLAQELLGNDLTDEAREFIAHYPELSLEHDAGFVDLVKHTNELLNYNPLSKEVGEAFNFNSLHYDIVLTLLTPAVIPSNIARVEPLIRSSHGSRELRKLTVDELLALNQVRNVLFEEGLSSALYRLCNQPDFAPFLTSTFIEILIGDKRFKERASDSLREKAREFFPKKIAEMEAHSESPISTIASRLFSPPVPQTAIYQSNFDQEGLKKKLMHIMKTIEGSMSHRVFFGISRGDKRRALRNLQTRLAEAGANVQEIYRDLLLVVTTHRMRFGFFSCYSSRKNNANTHSAITLSKELAKEENSALRSLLGIKSANSLGIRSEFTQAVANQDSKDLLMRKKK